MVSNMRQLLLRKGRNNRSNSDFQTFFEEFIYIDPTNDYKNIVRETVSRMIHASKLPADAMALVQKSPGLPIFYMLPKIHKQGNPGRPIV